VAKKTILTMVNDACSELGLDTVVSTTNAADLTATQLLALANREGKETSKRSTSAWGWQELRKEYTFNVQSTGIIPNCSFTTGSNVITIGTPPTQAPQIGWAVCTSGGSNATGFPYPTYVTAVVGNQVTVGNVASLTSTNTSIAFGQESYSLPSDYNFSIPGTQWDRGYRWQLFGPLTPQEWQVLKSGLSPTGPRRRWRLMGSLFYVDPIPYDSNLLVFEYYSLNWAMTGGTVAASSFTTDGDTYVLEDDLMTLGIMWRYKAAKGLDYQQLYETWDRAIQREIGHDTGARILRTDVQTPDVALLTSNQIPDTGYGSGTF
jgi:hypothetical protein